MGKPYLEVWGRAGPRVVQLTVDRVAIGTGDGNDVELAEDRQVSRLHAVVERYASGWTVKDLASRNGTFVNGERLWGERTLHDGDEMRAGRTRIVFRAGEGAAPETEASIAAPEVTRREREILAALCRPLADGDVFCEPASNGEIAGALVVSEAAVRQHIARLYDKFDLGDSTPRRRAQLANEAIRRGVVSPGDLRK